MNHCTYMTRTLITAIAFSFVYLVELLVFGIGPSKRVAEEGCPTAFSRLS